MEKQTKAILISALALAIAKDETGQVLPHICEHGDVSWLEEGSACPACREKVVWTPRMEYIIVEILNTIIAALGPWQSLAEISKQMDISLSTLATAAQEGRLPTIELADKRRLVRQRAALGRVGMRKPSQS
jgi:hypothetical protein